MAATRKWIKFVAVVSLFMIGGGGVRGQHATPAEPTSELPPLPATWHEDADLHDIHFVDSDYGWAVGGLGTIWHTRNGGEIWELQATPTRCQLASVCFVDRERGWAAGGKCLPITHRSVGVILQTTDGGKTWSEIRGLLLPWIGAIHFTSGKQGYAVGQCSAMQPSGAFATADGGRTWTPLSGMNDEHWHSASFLDQQGLLATRSGRTAWLSDGRIRPTALSQTSGVAWHAPYSLVLGPAEACVGQGGLPLWTTDGGASWTVSGQLPALLAPTFSLNSMSRSGEAWLLAGRPGTRILRSTDRGQTWQAISSGSPLPIHRLRTLTGGGTWAVGARGLILVSRDGGMSWNVQRGGSKRAALVGVFADERKIPWKLLARASAIDEYRVHIVILSPSETTDPMLCPVQHRLAAAAAEIGATSEILTQLELPPELLRLSASEILLRWRTLHPDVTDRVSSQLTRLIRTWRPDVLVTSHLASDGEPTGPERLVTQLVADAAEVAETDRVFPAQTQLGLGPWRVRRVLTASATNASAKPSARSDPFVTSKDVSLSLLAERCQRLVATNPPVDDQWTLKSSLEDINQQVADLGVNPMGGSTIKYATAGRRKRTIRESSLLRPDARRRREQIRNTLLRGGLFTGRGETRLQQAESLLQSLKEDEAGELLFDLAALELEAGFADEAERILRRFVTRYDRHPLSDAALQWLIAYHTSAEVAWIQRAGSPRSDGGIKLASSEVPLQTVRARGGNNVLATHETSNPDTDWAIGMRLAQQLKSKRPMLYAEPYVAFPLASISRLTQQPLAASSLYQRQMGRSAGSHWRQRAASELALLDTSDMIQQWTCESITQRPHLDGKLDDACWANLAPLKLVSSSSRASATEKSARQTSLGWLAHDDEFLYLAAICYREANLIYPPPRFPRPRDADLAERDRIRLCLDINRDYTSWWQFEFDHRGWTHDAAPSGTRWDPQYYVAAQCDDATWAVEVAIPLAEVAPESMRTGAAWVVGLQRIAPGSHRETLELPTRGVVASSELQGLLGLE